MAKPLLDKKTRNKVKFVYSDRPDTMKIIEDIFNMDELEHAFGGKNPATFNINDYAVRMREDDKKMPSFWSPENSDLASEPYLMSSQKTLESISSAKTEEAGSVKRESMETTPEPGQLCSTESEKEEQTQTESRTVEQKSLSGEDDTPPDKSALNLISEYHYET